MTHKDWYMVILIAAMILFAAIIKSHARDHGQFADSTPEKREFFRNLASGKGPCCSDIDGATLQDADWEAKDGHYRVRYLDQWFDVPPEAVITQPNLFGRTVLWATPYWENSKLDRLDIRCFMPGPMT